MPARRQIITAGAAAAAAFALSATGFGHAEALAAEPDSRKQVPKPLALRGVHYDTGTSYIPGQLSRQIWHPAAVNEELRTIRQELNCNAITIAGTNIQRLVQGATVAFKHGLHVWLQPRLFEATQQEMLDYLGEVAAAAEELRRQHGELVLNVGCELSMFTKGIVAGNDFNERRATLAASTVSPFPAINRVLAEHLKKASDVARSHFRGRITYSPIPWEDVDWSLFDILSTNNYRDDSNRGTYVERLRRLKRYGKPVVVTEFGCSTFKGAEKMGAMGFDIIDFSQDPPGIRDGFVRSEKAQADEIGSLLRIYEEEAIEGAFVYQFLSEGEVHVADPRRDLDMASHAIVKCLGIDVARGRINWEPKLAFHEIARIYGRA